MFDTNTHLPTFAPMPTPLDELLAFAEEHRNALLDAAELLGGTSGTCRAQSVLDGLGADDVPTRRTLRACDELLDLLTLEHVHDPDREESARFAAIDPASDCVEEICVLADTLSDALAAYRACTSAVPETSARKAAA